MTVATRAVNQSMDKWVGAEKITYNGKQISKVGVKKE